MGASLGININVAKQMSTNEIYQSSFSICSASCQNLSEDEKYIINNSSIVGDLNLSQKCNAEALCVMKTNLEAIAAQQLEAQSSVTTLSPGGLFNWTYGANTNVTSQTLENTYSQTINNLCQAEASNYRSGTLLYINDSSVVGDVDLSQSGSAQSQCAIENTASASVVQSSETEISTFTKSGSVLIILSIVTAIILVTLGTAYFAAEQKKSEGEARTGQLKTLAETGALEKLSANEINAILSGTPVYYTPGTV
jgi:high-affinity nickel permease